jgi:hypothetical protein
VFEKANEPKELFIVENARHYDVYEGENFIKSSGKALGVCAANRFSKPI